jgi:hypothetical protein
MLLFMSLRYLLFAFLFLPLTLPAQCFDPIIELNTQAEVDAFPATYGGCSGLSFKDYVINGSGITSLAPLAALDDVRSLEIRNTGLVSLAGLENLLAVGGELSIRSNSSLTSLTGLSGLVYVGELKLESNNNLVSLQALSSLTTIALNLTIISNFDLPSLAGLENVAAPSNRIEISNNSSITDISALSGMDMTQINGNPALRITINELLSDCAIASVCDLLDDGGNVDISNNGRGAQPSECLDAAAVTTACTPAPTCSDGLQNGDETGVDCGGSGCVPCSCSSLTTINNNITFTTQQQIDDFFTINGDCIKINGSVRVEAGFFSSDPITNLHGLTGVREITGTLNIINNPELSTIHGLSRITTIGGTFQFWGGDVRVFKELESLTSVEVFRIRNTQTDTIFGPSNLVEAEQVSIILNSTKYVGGFEKLDSATVGIFANLGNGLEVRGFENMTTSEDISLEANLVDAFYNLNSTDRLFLGKSNLSSQAFANIQEVTELFIQDFAGNEIYDFPNLILGENGRGVLRVQNCPNITSLGNLLFANDTISEISLSRNDNLANISSLTGIKTVFNRLEISLNPSLTSLSGLNLLDSVGQLRLISLPIIDFQPLSALRKTGDIEISRCNTVNNLEGLSSLKEARFFIIENCATLTGLEGLNSLDLVFATFITSNENLMSLAGLSLANPDLFTTGLFHEISSNPNLTTCAVLPVCRGVASGMLFLSENSVQCGQNVNDNCGGFLPITLTSLTATPTEKTTHLHWQTASESQNHGFHLQHRSENSGWVTIDFVSGQGESNTLQEYEYEHRSPTPGENYYRLLQEDFDGTQTASPIVTVNFAHEAKMVLFPNPVRQSLTVAAAMLADEEGAFTINVRDSQGRTVLQVSSQTTLNVADLPPGVYLLTLITDQQQVTKRFIKQ